MNTLKEKNLNLDPKVYSLQRGFTVPLFYIASGFRHLRMTYPKNFLLYSKLLLIIRHFQIANKNTPTSGCWDSQEMNCLNEITKEMTMDLCVYICTCVYVHVHFCSTCVQCSMRTYVYLLQKLLYLTAKKLSDTRA